MADDVLNEDALTAAHMAVENTLVDFRDSRISQPLCANGFVIRESDGRPSSTIRLGTRNGLMIGIRAYLDAIADPEAARAKLKAYVEAHAPKETP